MTLKPENFRTVSHIMMARDKAYDYTLSSMMNLGSTLTRTCRETGKSEVYSDSGDWLDDNDANRQAVLESKQVRSVEEAVAIINQSALAKMN
jgi:hypothetical protein